MVLSRENVDELERTERLESMRSMETSRYYAVPDYLSPSWQRRLRRAALAEEASEMTTEEDVVDEDDENGDDAITGGSSEDDEPESSRYINEGWRDQVCVWCYAVADHYGERRDRERETRPPRHVYNSFSSASHL
jgi:hypothetical protein